MANKKTAIAAAVLAVAVIIAIALLLFPQLPPAAPSTPATPVTPAETTAPPAPKEKLIIYYPLPSRLSDEVEKRLRRAREAVELYASLGKERVERIRENLRRMARL